jgi:hypothetical protein
MSAPRPRSRKARRLGGLTLAVVLLTAGCADMATDLGIKSGAPATIQADIKRTKPVTQSGRPAAVLSIHSRKSFQNACQYGMTVTNNLPYKIVSLSFRIAAIIDGDVAFDAQTKEFSQFRPSEQLYREITFQGVTCDRIKRLEVSDPGRCTLETLNRFNSSPGDCAKFSDIANSSLVSVVKTAASKTATKASNAAAPDAR